MWKLFIILIFGLLLFVSCNYGSEEKAQTAIDSIVKIEKQKVIDSINISKQDSENNHQQSSSKEKKKVNQNINENESAEKQNLHVDKSGGIHFGQPKN